MPESPLPVIRIAILGCGNVGASLVELLLDPAGAADLARRAGARLEVVGVAVADASKARPSAPHLPVALLTEDAAGLVARDDLDLVVELMGGLEPAGSLVASVLTRGVPVVTGNKALLADRGLELGVLAQTHGTDLGFEAAVGGVVPVIRTLRESFAGESITRVMGIVNGTTNFILSTMADQGSSYDDVLAEAQALGYAEADPTADVEGYDAAAKAAILARLAFGCPVPIESVYREGITGVRGVDVSFARHLGFAVKLLAIAEQVGDGEISARVHPTMVPLDHPLASVGGAFNAVFIEGRASGPVMLYGQGAGGLPTASAVLGDVIDAARHRLAGSYSPAPTSSIDCSPVGLDELRSAFYLSIDVADRPGVLAAVATAFGDNHISIRSMEQVGLGDEARLIFLTHTATERDMAATLASLETLDVVDAIGGVLRVIDGEEEGN